MASDYLLEIDGIKGESQDHKHKEAIHVESFSWGVSQPGSFATSGGGGAGKCNFSDITFSKTADKASTDLMLACASGKHIAKALLTVRKAGDKPVEYLKIKLEDVLVSSIQQSGGASDIPMESFSLNFAKFTIEYAEQKKDGTGAAGKPVGWDLKKNEKC